MNKKLFIFFAVALAALLFFVLKVPKKETVVKVSDQKNEGERLVTIQMRNNAGQTRVNKVRARESRDELPGKTPSKKIRNYIEISSDDQVLKIHRNLKSVKLQGHSKGESLDSIDKAQRAMSVMIDLPTRTRYPHSYFEKNGWLYIWGGINNNPQHGYAIKMDTGEFYVWKTYADKKWDRHLTGAQDYFFELKDLAAVPR